MRGRRPRPLEIAPHDVPILQQIARSRSLPWYQVQRAQVLLAVAAGEPIRTLAIRTQCNPSTVWRICRRYEDAGLPDLLEPPQRAGRPARISALQRAQIVQLACLEPVAKGLHITHWTSQDLARQAVEDGIVPAISDRTVQAILNQVDLQPHRTRYWRTSRIDTHFKERAEKILWCYANAERLARRGFWVVCADEKPNFQVLERHPIRHSIPGSIAQREFDYTRHGTVNILFFLIVHSGQMEAACFDAKSAEHYVQELRAFRHRHRHLRGVYLIHDNDPTHTAAKTRDYLAGGLRLVAKSLHPGPRLVARRSGVVGRRIRLPLPEARIVAQSSRVHRLREASLAGVQSVVRPSIRMDMVESEDEAVG